MITIAAAIFATNLKDKGDHKPWCYFPNKYPSTMQVVDFKVDIPSYMGTWHEIVSKAGAFEELCVCSDANYTFNSDKGFVNVDNTCVTKQGSLEAVGKAYPENSNNSKLEVFFNPTVGGNYWILALDKDYQHVLVGEPCRDEMWILARTKTLDQSIIDNYLQIAKTQGYDVKKMKYRGKGC